MGWNRVLLVECWWSVGGVMGSGAALAWAVGVGARGAFYCDPTRAELARHHQASTLFLAALICTECKWHALRIYCITRCSDIQIMSGLCLPVKRSEVLPKPILRGKIL